MNIYEHHLYKEDVERVAELVLPWENFQDASVFISGATGLIGSFFVDVLMWRNTNKKANWGEVKKRHRSVFLVTLILPFFILFPIILMSQCREKWMKTWILSYI